MPVTKKCPECFRRIDHCRCQEGRCVACGTMLRDPGKAPDRLCGFCRVEMAMALKDEAA
jgi:hypothetical protein